MEHHKGQLTLDALASAPDLKEAERNVPGSALGQPHPTPNQQPDRGSNSDKFNLSSSLSLANQDSRERANLSSSRYLSGVLLSRCYPCRLLKRCVRQGQSSRRLTFSRPLPFSPDPSACPRRRPQGPSRRRQATRRPATSSSSASSRV